MSFTKIIKVGNSHYVNIPLVYMDRLSLSRGVYVSVELTERGLLIKPLKLTEGRKVKSDEHK